MDRIEFMKQLDCDARIIEKFDEFMSLYDLTNVHLEKASMSINNSKTLSLDLKLPSNSLAIKVKGSLDRAELNNYDNRYVVETTLKNKTINIKLNRVSG